MGGMWWLNGRMQLLKDEMLWHIAGMCMVTQ